MVKPSTSSLRITPPARAARSSTTHATPCRDNSYAAASPAMPPPTTTISAINNKGHKGYKGHKGNQDAKKTSTSDITNIMNTADAEVVTAAHARDPRADR